MTGHSIVIILPAKDSEQIRHELNNIPKLANPLCPACLESTFKAYLIQKIEANSATFSDKEILKFIWMQKPKTGIGAANMWQMP